MDKREGQTRRTNLRGKAPFDRKRTYDSDRRSDKTEGVVYTDVSSALKSAGVEIPAANYVGGLGGRSIYKTDIEKIYEELLAGTAKVGEASFVNLRRDICGA